MPNKPKEEEEEKLLSPEEVKDHMDAEEARAAAEMVPGKPDSGKDSEAVQAVDLMENGQYEQKHARYRPGDPPPGQSLYPEVNASLDTASENAGRKAAATEDLKNEDDR